MSLCRYRWLAREGLPTRGCKPPCGQCSACAPVVVVEPVVIEDDDASEGE